MLKLLRIKNIAVIAGVELELRPGLTALTGETGAGKSILIDALGLLLGERSSSELIRTGEEQAVVEAIVDAGGAAALLDAHGLPCEDGEIVIRREILSSGKGRATVNGALVPVSVLRDLAPRVATIHGQHGAQGLLDADAHLEIVDRSAGLVARADELAQAFAALREAEGALRALRQDRREIERRRETLLHQADEIERAGLAAGEDDALRAEKSVQANADKLAALTAEAYALLYDAEDAVLPRLGQAFRKVEDLARLDARFAPFLEGRAAARAQLEDLALFLRDYAGRLEVAPGRLDEIEERLALVERLKRRYGATVEEVLAFGASCRAQLEALEDPEAREGVLEARRAEASARYLALATALSARRREAGDALAARVRKELAQLAMEKTRFECSFERLAGDADADTSRWTERGIDEVEFLLSPNPGEDLRPLARIASGGELSRILLALNAVAAADAPPQTMVFDEVDAGIGGRVAEVVGRKLRAVARTHQVLCVTHLPQIASLADQHFAVTKRQAKGRTLTDVRALDPGERVEEVARMLGGETITDATRKHAREMVRDNGK
jgi:DNA repair protein RecN (Recombination protein N)